MGDLSTVFRNLRQFCYGYAILTLAVDPQTVAFDTTSLLELVMNSLAQDTGSLAVDNADGGQICHNRIVQENGQG